MSAYSIQFRLLPIGSAFTFESEVTFPHSGLESGPWRKISARKYVPARADHRLAGHELRVGTIAVRVIPQPSPVTV